MSTPYPTIRHRCDFCRKSYASKWSATKHEALCSRNPALSACPTCAHYQPSPFIDCALGLAEYDHPTHPADDGMHRWTKNCPAWLSRLHQAEIDPEGEPT